MTQPYPPHKTDFNNVSQRTGKGIDAAIDTAGHTALHMSVRKGDLAATKRLLNLRANPHHPDKQGQPPIYEAIATQNIALVKLLLDAGATFRMEDDARRTPLMWAIEQKCDVRFLKQLRELGMAIDYPNKIGRQPLHVAAAANRPDVIDYLVKNNVSADIADSDGKTAVHVAVENKAQAALEKLIAIGASPIVRTKEIKTPLYIAAANGDDAAVKTLLEQPSVRQTLNDFKSYAEGWSPLMAAVANNRYEVAEKLLAMGAEVNQRDTQNRQALFLAVENGHPRLVELLLRQGAEVEKGPRPAVPNASPMLHRINASNTSNPAAYGEILMMLYTAGANLDITDQTGQTALYRAADWRELQKIKPLLDLGANPNLADNYGRRPIDASMTMATWAFDVVRETVALLLSYRADPNLSPAASAQYAPLHQAVRSGRKELVELLLKYNVIIDEPDRTYGSTPWLTAIETRNLDSAELLRQKGADTFRRDKQMKSVLHIAAASGLKDMLESCLLIPSMAEQVNVPDTYGVTPLQYAARTQKADCVRVLLLAGANADLYDQAGQAALHQAVNSGSEFLLAAFENLPGKKINWNIQSRDERETPLHVAVRRGFQPVLERLLKQDVDLSISNKQGLSPLLAAITTDQVPLTTMLANYMKSKKIPLDGQRDPSGQTALHLAAGRWTPVIATVLLDAGADMNVRAPGGDTPLHAAVRSGRLENLRLLVTRGANATLANDAGATALDLAVGLKQEAAIALLLQAMKEQKEAAVKRQSIKPPQP